MFKPMLVSAVLATFAMSVAQAQAARGSWRATATSSASSRRGVATTTQPQATQPPSSSPFGAPTPHVVAVKLVPAVIMSDGSVLADFGFGLEPVRRACVGGVGGLGDTRSLSSGATMPTQSIPGIQPAPAQRTASQQNLTSQPQFRQPSRAALGSCFTRDASGRVFVTR